MECPLCNTKSVGKVGSNQFYCWDCYIEFLVQKEKTLIYQVCDDGSLIPYGQNENAVISGS